MNLEYLILPKKWQYKNFINIVLIGIQMLAILFLIIKNFMNKNINKI